MTLLTFCLWPLVWEMFSFSKRVMNSVRTWIRAFPAHGVLFSESVAAQVHTGEHLHTGFWRLESDKIFQNLSFKIKGLREKYRTLLQFEGEISLKLQDSFSYIHVMYGISYSFFLKNTIKNGVTVRIYSVIFFTFSQYLHLLFDLRPIWSKHLDNFLC